LASARAALRAAETLPCGFRFELFCCTACSRFDFPRKPTLTQYVRASPLATTPHQENKVPWRALRLGWAKPGRIGPPQLTQL